MKYVISKQEGSPAYLQLYKQLREDIVGGIYPFGAKLPSKRTIAEEVSVSTITVEHAYSLLCDEGYIEARERSGYFNIFSRDDGFAGVKSEPTVVVRKDSISHEEGQFPFSTLAKAMRSVISEMGEGILERSENIGRKELREAISRYLAASRGIKASPSQIVVGSGSEYLYGLIVELIGRDKTFAIEAPSYKKIEQVYKAADVVLEMLPLSHDGIDSRKLKKSNADVLHITPYRSFPSGVTASASKRHEYVRWASRKGKYIVEDDFESEFSVSHKPEETVFSLSDNDNVIYMNSFSKTISPSMRVGYMVLPQNLAERFSEKLGFYSCTVPTFVQLLIAKLILDGDFERHINRVRRHKRRSLAK
ncbi:MAG: PLP-dependent aminotransferase family protein [Oscillospiraceae bacterium]|nr:PLP-dependent aminotransferase family protein [Oscillospiraceae bacterium]